MASQYHYFPVLRFKRGERVALEQLSRAARPGTFPVFVIQPEQYTEKKATASQPRKTAADKVAEYIDTIWGKSPFYVHASQLPVQTGSSGAVYAISDIADACRARGLPMMPAARLSDPNVYVQTAVKEAKKDQLGLGLFVDLQQFSNISTWVPKWSMPLGETDLFVDFSDNVARVSALGGALDPTFTGLASGPNWRSVVTFGSSMPENFSGYQAGLHTIRREEFLLWQRLSSISSLGYRLHYGDYATVPIVPPPTGIKWGFPINVRYTLPKEFLICRGVSTTGYGAVDMDQQLIGHAKDIAGYAGRNRIACWGDAEIDNISSGKSSQGNLETWVQISVNRHIELTRQQIP